jgi:hypothetical protein
MQQNINAKFKDYKYFVDEVETLIKKNNSRAAKPKKSTIQKTKLVTRQKYSHNPMQ